jgi:hypothetical protein
MTKKFEQVKVEGGAVQTRRGRPSKFNMKLALKMFFCWEKGFTDEEVCRLFDIAVDTLNKWKANSAVFRSSMEKAKKLADQRVVEALHKRAIGYDFEERTARTEGQGETAKTIQQVVRKHIPPSDKAIMMWLVNRDPNNWKHLGPKVEVTQDNRSVNVVGSPDQIAEYMKGLYGPKAREIGLKVADALGIRLEIGDSEVGRK